MPGPGDRVTLAHDVTLTDERTLSQDGASPAITINAGGIFRIAEDSRLNSNGNITCQNNNRNQFFMAPGSVLNFQGEARIFQTATQYPGSNPCLIIEGTQQKPATIRTEASVTTKARITGTTNYYGLMLAEWVIFENMGGADASAIQCSPNSDGSDANRSRFILSNFRMINCGHIQQASNVGAHAIFELANGHFENTLSTYCVTGSMYSDRSGNGYRRIRTCSFDKQNFIQAPRDLEYESNVTRPLIVSNTDAQGWASYSHNFLYYLTESQQNCIGDFTGNYVCYDKADQINPHYTEVGQFASINNYEVSENVFEFLGEDPDGDCVLIGSPPTAGKKVVITRNITLPTSANDSPGTVFSALGNANVNYEATFNTGFIGTNEGGAPFVIGENFAGNPGQCEAFVGNIGWDTSPRGLLMNQFGSTINLLDADDAVFNVRWNALTGSAGNGYGTTGTGEYGSADIEANPEFVDPTRNIAAWDAALGGPGTAENAIAELRKLNTPEHDERYTAEALIEWVRHGFKVTNPALETFANGETPGAAGFYEVPLVEGGADVSLLFMQDD